MITRFHDWPERLAEFFEQSRNRAFAWGETDCCLFVCDGVLAMTGVDLAADFRGKYSTQLEALRVIRDFAGGDLEALAEKIAEQHGIQEIPVFLAQRGDVLLFLQEFGDDVTAPTLGIMGTHGTHAISTSELRGPVAEISLLECVRAWRIG